MKREKQINESRELIAQAFQKLLGEADYKEITLTEIADHAGLSRMTLHRHFKSKEQIVLYMAQKNLDRAWKKRKGGNASLSDLSLFQLEQLKSMPNRHILIVSREIWDILESFRKDSWTRQVEKALKVNFEQDPYLFHFLFGGISNIIYEWLKCDCRESVAEMRDRIMIHIEKYIPT